MEIKRALGAALLGCIVGAGACAWSAPSPLLIQKGSLVSMHYTLTVDRQVVDSSTGKAPLSYVQGMGQIIPGLEENMAGLKKGDKRRIIVSPEKGYGKLDPDAFQNVARRSVPNGKKVKVGTVLTGTKNGHTFRARVVDADPDMLTLDLNHPLAGKTLQFDVEVMDVRPAQQ